MTNILSDFMEGAAELSYKGLVQRYIKRQSAPKLEQAVLDEVSSLPDEYFPIVMDCVKKLNSKLGYNQDFWINASCMDAFEEIMDIAIDALPIQHKLATVESAFEPENQELAFQLFLISTISFAHFASTKKRQRKYMGIRKNIFG